MYSSWCYLWIILTASISRNCLIFFWSKKKKVQELNCEEIEQSIMNTYTVKRNHVLSLKCFTFVCKAEIYWWIWKRKFYLKDPKARREGAHNHRWRNFLDDLKKQIRLDTTYQRGSFIMKANIHGANLPPFSVSLLWVHVCHPIYMYADPKKKYKGTSRSILREIHSHLVSRLENTACITGSIWNEGECKNLHANRFHKRSPCIKTLCAQKTKIKKI